MESVSNKFSEPERREVYSQVFNIELYGYGDVHMVHSWARFARDNDDICFSYKKKNKKWEQFLALGRKYSPQWVFPEEAYRKEGLMPDIPPQESHLNDSGTWTEEERKRFEDELEKKLK